MARILVSLRPMLTFETLRWRRSGFSSKTQHHSLGQKNVVTYDIPEIPGPRSNRHEETQEKKYENEGEEDEHIQWEKLKTADGKGGLVPIKRILPTGVLSKA